MKDAEGIGYVAVTELGEVVSEAGLALFLTGMKAQVLEQQDAAVRKLAGELPGAPPDTVIGVQDVAVQEFGEAGAAWLRAEATVDPPGRTPQVGS